MNKTDFVTALEKIMSNKDLYVHFSTKGNSDFGIICEDGQFNLHTLTDNDEYIFDDIKSLLTQLDSWGMEVASFYTGKSE